VGWRALCVVADRAGFQLSTRQESLRQERYTRSKNEAPSKPSHLGMILCREGAKRNFFIIFMGLMVRCLVFSFGIDLRV
jgi:hypothetical protein